MTVNEFIKQLENLKPSLREGEIFLVASNGILFEPKAKTLLNEGYYPFDNVEDKIKIKGTIITYE